MKLQSYKDDIYMSAEIIKYNIFFGIEEKNFKIWLYFYLQIDVIVGVLIGAIQSPEMLLLRKALKYFSKLFSSNIEVYFL